MHDAADNAAIVHPLDAPDIRRQARLDPLPLLIARPKQVSAHDPNPLPKKRIRIVLSERNGISLNLDAVAFGLGLIGVADDLAD